MKKTYIVPTMDVVEINFTSQLLAGSPAAFDNSGSGEIHLTDENPDPGEILSPGMGFIDFE